MKENSFFEASTFQGDGTTIKYDATKPNRSDAVGKAYKRNSDGTHSLVEDGDEVAGIVCEVGINNNFTGAYLFGGLLFLIGHNQTVARGDKIVGALGPSSAKGYIKTATLVQSTDDTIAKVRTALIEERKGRGTVLEFDTTKALVAFAGR